MAISASQTALLDMGPSLPDDRALTVLWRSCAAQAVRDLASTDAEIALDAAQWIFSDDFETVCDFAGVDSVWFLEEIQRRIAMKQPYRKFSLIKFAMAMNTSLTQREHPVDRTGDDAIVP
jgi:ketosteroid isomerase-like protein